MIRFHGLKTRVIFQQEKNTSLMGLYMVWSGIKWITGGAFFVTVDVIVFI